MTDSTTGNIRVLSDGAGRHVDILSAVSAVLFVTALAGWFITGLIAVRTAHDQNSGWVILAAAPTCTATTCAVVTATAATIRRYVRHLIDHDVAAVCRRIDRLGERLSLGDGADRSAQFDNGAWRGYLARTFDQDQDKDKDK